jgi:hypothetical protein
MVPLDMSAGQWRSETRTGRELVGEWVEGYPTIAAAGRALALGPNARQRLWSYLRLGTGLGVDGLRVARIVGIPFEAVLFGDAPVCDLFDPGLAEVAV